MQKILVSACLVGQPVRYDGASRRVRDPLIDRWLAEDRLVIVCPEVAAGLGIPRLPAEIVARRSGADVLAGVAAIRDTRGNDVTAVFVAGARHALALAIAGGCRHALLTDGSPSCGSTFIYDGTFSGADHPGEGVTAALLRAHGVAVYTPDRIGELAAALDDSQG
ncbi:DUF523 domain-containing protein [Paraburkholderia caballeronis]|uniref:DUF523 domain-containing protein n=1 Tax=Paraburkholderia caballeronis TaxID=416943 RepID=UPI00106613D9|nr:DUF523 domain-containing protein [Paraburkholderia caballeronis]TDV09523.1 uncharacterized protein YbbK (DUF523 family) [Paraburkholderia caballeronis]TDV13794.1 uncharacterized protein YbbK (DUF523 family) [Paraburkholderia caballeronis]TDV22976.1 uncharacterized protein YbbK (DUF523 family) [Paraburkholderia caballeronis]TDV28642.1 uncharacterized protein YbbK (DUF523 family) [Paraburkholderia caballeronis]